MYRFQDNGHSRHPLNVRSLVAAVLLLLATHHLSSGQTWHSTRFVPGTDGHWTSIPDAAGNRIPDFSYAGYRNSDVPIPDVPVVRTIDPLPGDNTAHIQSALDAVAALPLNADGFRGALLLAPGRYRLSGTVRVNASGVVLRGSGDGADSTRHTILSAVGDSATQTTVIVAGGGSDTKWSHQVSGTLTTITTDTVFVGARTFEVANGSLFVAGDNIIITHPCTAAWLSAIDNGGTATDAPWAVNEQPIVYNRRVISVDGNRLTIDAPVFATLVRSLSQSTVYRYARTGLRTNVGIEDLRIDIAAPGVTTDRNGNEHDHAWHGIWLRQIEDAWVRRSTILHFGQSGIITSTATRVTVDSCAALDPVSIVTGERRYNFNVYTASQLILFRGCRASHGRHDYVSNGTSWTSGCVFFDCSSDSTYASTEGHRRWTQGLLYDNVSFTRPLITGYVLGLYNRGDYGTGHGWASVHSVVWNSSAPGRAFVVQRPPTAQNYAIGCNVDTVAAAAPIAPFPQPLGFVEGTRRPGLEPRSLFQAQLANRLNGPTNVGTQEGVDLPRSSALLSAFPSPFNSEVTLEVVLPEPGTVRISAHDILGRMVRILDEGSRPSGTHQMRWDARGVASGTYLVRLEFTRAGTSGPSESIIRRVVLLR